MKISSSHKTSALMGVALAVMVGLLPSAPAQAEPDIGDVQARVDRLYHQGEQAQERYHDAKIELKSIDGELDSLEADVNRQERQLEVAKDEVRDSVVSQYEGQGLSAVGSVIVAEDPSEFLSQMTTMSTYADLQDDLYDDYSTELKALDIRRDITADQAGRLEATKEKLAAEQETVDRKVAEAETLLGRLEEEEREELAAEAAAEEERAAEEASDNSASSSADSSSAEPATSDVPVSGRAAAAVAYAKSKVGGTYVYGASGPNSFDCSGLTTMAWAAAGVSLPRSSGAQSAGGGSRVAADDLQPGDLVFYYSPISHVGIYVGDGMIVHAANPSTGVAMTGVYSMPYSGAVRPG